jgi:hypothetical protein
MVCDINRSISIGILTTVVMATIILFWIGIDNVKKMNTNIVNVIFFVCVLFVISTSMDYFNQCYTTCDNIKSSVLYSLFAVTMIYLFYSLFVNPFQLNASNMVMYSSNVVLIGLLHYFTCNIGKKNLY